MEDMYKEWSEDQFKESVKIEDKLKKGCKVSRQSLPSEKYYSANDVNSLRDRYVMERMKYDIEDIFKERDRRQTKDCL